MGDTEEAAAPAVKGTTKATKSEKEKNAAEKVGKSVSADEEVKGMGGGDGWTKMTVERNTGKTKGTYDTYFYSPAKEYKFRSKSEVQKFLDCLKKAEGGNDEEKEDSAYKAFKGATKRSGKKKTTTTAAKTRPKRSSSATKRKAPAKKAKTTARSSAKKVTKKKKTTTAKKKAAPKKKATKAKVGRPKKAAAPKKKKAAPPKPDPIVVEVNGMSEDDFTSQRLAKHFKGEGDLRTLFQGTVKEVSYKPKSSRTTKGTLWTVEYDDGDKEEMDADDIREGIILLKASERAKKNKAKADAAKAKEEAAKKAAEEKAAAAAKADDGDKAKEEEKEGEKAAADA